MNTTPGTRKSPVGYSGPPERFDGTENGIDAARPHGELVHVGLAEDKTAGHSEKKGCVFGAKCYKTFYVCNLRILVIS